MDSKTNILNPGVVVSVRGSVVDIRFDQHLPPIYAVLRAGDGGRIVIEVLAHRDGRRVRGIALTPTLARGMRRRTLAALKGARRQKDSIALHLGHRDR